MQVQKIYTNKAGDYIIRYKKQGMPNWRTIVEGEAGQWQRYLNWIAEGNEPEIITYTPPTIVQLKATKKSEIITTFESLIGREIGITVTHDSNDYNVYCSRKEYLEWQTRIDCWTTGNKNIRKYNADDEYYTIDKATGEAIKLAIAEKIDWVCNRRDTRVYQIAILPDDDTQENRDEINNITWG